PKTPFYHYIGDSPYPPCNMQATMIVFDNNHASTINTSDLELIKKTIIPAKKNTSSKKEGFVGGDHRGVFESFVAYNSNGANNTETDETSQAMECTEYYDTDPTSTSSSGDASTKTSSIDWSKITQSPAFIVVIVLLAILAGGIFFYYVLWPMIRKRLDGVPVANESADEGTPEKIPKGEGEKILKEIAAQKKKEETAAKKPAAAAKKPAAAVAKKPAAAAKKPAAAAKKPPAAAKKPAAVAKKPAAATKKPAAAAKKPPAAATKNQQQQQRNQQAKVHRRKNQQQQLR
ncbi:unnamed protein product, partial [marine sediment metagenome]